MNTNRTTSGTKNDDQAVRDVISGLYAAWAENDANSFAELYTEDATVVMPGEYRTNKEEVRNYMAGAFAGPLKGSRAIDEPQSIRFIGDSAAIVISEGGILMAGETELPAARRVRATWGMAKQNGAWRIASYHNCPAT